MITQEEAKRLEELRKKIFDQIQICLQEDCYCKDYEGAIGVRFPNYFDEKYGAVNCYYLDLALYVFGPNRGYTWSGNTLLEAIEKAHRDVDKWIKIRGTDEEHYNNDDNYEFVKEIC